MANFRSFELSRIALFGSCINGFWVFQVWSLFPIFVPSMDFLALDFETATPQLDSPCELGIAIVRGGVVREVKNWLIKPKYWPFFSQWNVAVHGIRPADVENAPRWEQIRGGCCRNEWRYDRGT